MWFRNTKDAEEALKVKTATDQNDVFEPDIRHWQIPSCRRFRALKLWFVMRIYGIEGLQKHIRHQISLAKYLEQLVRADARFELLISSLGVVCFRLRGDDFFTQKLLDRISERRKLFIMPYYYQGKLVVRFVICSRLTEPQDIVYAWNEISFLVEEILNNNNEDLPESQLLKEVTTVKMSAELSEKISVGLFL